MEFLLDILFDIIVEGSIALGSEKRVPMPLRVLAVILVFVVFIGMGGAFIFMSYEAMMEQDSGTAVILAAVGAFILFGGIYVIYDMFRKKKSKCEEGEF